MDHLAGGISLDDLRFPIGPFVIISDITQELRSSWIEELAESSKSLRMAVDGLTEQQLNTPYRPGGWTLRQVVHHLADANLNGYFRFKHALTEQVPLIKPFDESLWAELPDSCTAPIDSSLELYEQLHYRWLYLMDNMKPDSFARSYRHPANGLWTLDTALSFFSWHARHHIAHITSLRKQRGW